MNDSENKNPGTGEPDNGLPPWRQDLAAALNRNRTDPTSRYLQLATIRTDGAPANRTLVFRGFDDRTGELLMVSDERSSKPAELRAEPRAATAWYFARTREQYRFSGTVRCVLPTDDATAHAYCQRMWSNLSSAARAQYFWPEPGTPLDEPGAATERSPESQQPSNSPYAPDARRAPTADQAEQSDHEPPPWFLVLALTITEVDHLELRPTPQRRAAYRLASGQWQKAEINP